jgi:hypothetical protein
MGVDTENGRSSHRVRCHRTPFRSNFQKELQLIANLHPPWASRNDAVNNTPAQVHKIERVHSLGGRRTMKPHLGWPRCRYAD